MCTHLSNLRGGMAVDSRWRSSWLIASTSCLVRTPLRSNSSTKAAFSHMLEMASYFEGREVVGVEGFSHDATAGM